MESAPVAYDSLPVAKHTYEPPVNLSAGKIERVPSAEAHEVMVESVSSTSETLADGEMPSRRGVETKARVAETVMKKRHVDQKSTSSRSKSKPTKLSHSKAESSRRDRRSYSPPKNDRWLMMSSKSSSSERKRTEVETQGPKTSELEISSSVLTERREKNSVTRETIVRSLSRARKHSPLTWKETEKDVSFSSMLKSSGSAIGKADNKPDYTDTVHGKCRSRSDYRENSKPEAGSNEHVECESAGRSIEEHTEDNVMKRIKEIRRNIESAADFRLSHSPERPVLNAAAVSYPSSSNIQHSEDSGNLITSGSGSVVNQSAVRTKYWSDADETETESDMEIHLLHFNSVNIVLNHLKKYPAKYAARSVNEGDNRNRSAHQKASRVKSRKSKFESRSKNKGDESAFKRQRSLSRPWVGKSYSKVSKRQQSASRGTEAKVHTRKQSRRQSESRRRRPRHSSQKDDLYSRSANQPHQAAGRKEYRATSQNQGRRYTTQRSRSPSRRTRYRVSHSPPEDEKHLHARTSEDEERLHARTSHSPPDYRGLPFLFGSQEPHSPDGYKRCSQGWFERSLSPLRYQRSRSPSRDERHKRYISPGRYERSLSPLRYGRSRSPSRHEGHETHYSPERFERSLSPSRYERSCSPSRHEGRETHYSSERFERSLSPPRYRRSRSPSRSVGHVGHFSNLELEGSLSPLRSGKPYSSPGRGRYLSPIRSLNFSPPKDREESCTWLLEQSFPTEYQEHFSFQDYVGRSSPSRSRASFSPTEYREQTSHDWSQKHSHFGYGHPSPIRHERSSSPVRYKGSCSPRHGMHCSPEPEPQTHYSSHGPFAEDSTKACASSDLRKSRASYSCKASNSPYSCQRRSSPQGYDRSRSPSTSRRLLPHKHSRKSRQDFRSSYSRYASQREQARLRSPRQQQRQRHYSKQEETRLDPRSSLLPPSDQGYWVKGSAGWHSPLSRAGSPTRDTDSYYIRSHQGGASPRRCGSVLRSFEAPSEVRSCTVGLKQPGFRTTEKRTSPARPKDQFISGTRTINGTGGELNLTSSESRGNKMPERLTETHFNKKIRRKRVSCTERGRCKEMLNNTIYEPSKRSEEILSIRQLKERKTEEWVQCQRKEYTTPEIQLDAVVPDRRPLRGGNSRATNTMCEEDEEPIIERPEEYLSKMHNKVVYDQPRFITNVFDKLNLAIGYDANESLTAAESSKDSATTRILATEDNHKGAGGSTEGRVPAVSCGGGGDGSDPPYWLSDSEWEQEASQTKVTPHESPSRPSQERYVNVSLEDARLSQALRSTQDETRAEERSRTINEKTSLTLSEAELNMIMTVLEFAKKQVASGAGHSPFLGAPGQGGNAIPLPQSNAIGGLSMEDRVRELSVIQASLGMRNKVKTENKNDFLGTVARSTSSVGHKKQEIHQQDLTTKTSKIQKIEHSEGQEKGNKSLDSNEDGEYCKRGTKRAIRDDEHRKKSFADKNPSTNNQNAESNKSLSSIKQNIIEHLKNLDENLEIQKSAEFLKGKKEDSFNGKYNEDSFKKRNKVESSKSKKCEESFQSKKRDDSSKSKKSEESSKSKKSEESIRNKKSEESSKSKKSEASSSSKHKSEGSLKKGGCPSEYSRMSEVNPPSQEKHVKHAAIKEDGSTKPGGGKKHSKQAGGMSGTGEQPYGQKTLTDQGKTSQSDGKNISGKLAARTMINTCQAVSEKTSIELRNEYPIKTSKSPSVKRASNNEGESISKVQHVSQKRPRDHLSEPLPAKRPKVASEESSGVARDEPPQWMSKTIHLDHIVKTCLSCDHVLVPDVFTSINISTGTVTMKCRKCHSYTRMEKVVPVDNLMEVTPSGASLSAKLIEQGEKQHEMHRPANKESKKKPLKPLRITSDDEASSDGEYGPINRKKEGKETASVEDTRFSDDDSCDRSEKQRKKIMGNVDAGVDSSLVGGVENEPLRTQGKLKTKTLCDPDFTTRNVINHHVIPSKTTRPNSTIKTNQFPFLSMPTVRLGLLKQKGPSSSHQVQDVG